MLKDNELFNLIDVLSDGLSTLDSFLFKFIKSILFTNVELLLASFWFEYFNDGLRGINPELVASKASTVEISDLT